MPGTSVVSIGQPPGFTVVTPGGQRSRTPLAASPFLIGRQSGNQLVLRDNRVSRVHARVTREGSDYFIEDAQSRHGTFVNGQQISQREKLFPGDSVTFGVPDGYQLIFEPEEERGINRLAEQVMTTSFQGGTGSGLVKLRALVEVARAVQASLSIEEVLESVVDGALSVAGSERGFLFLLQPSGLELRVARDSGGRTLQPDELHVSTRLIGRALRERRELLRMDFDPLAADGGGLDHSLAGSQLRTVLCVPLVRSRPGNTTETVMGPLAETIGLIYLDSRLDIGDIGSANQEILQTLALEASTIIENARLLEQERAKKRLDEELRIAREIQRTLRPATLPREGWFRVAAASDSSLQVGGDYYDVTRATPDCWVFVVADVSGKGVSSALLASLLQGALIAAPHDTAGIAHLLARTNAYVYERAEGEKYATLFYGALHADGTLLHCSAGHGQIALIQPDGTVEEWGADSLPVGMLPVGEFPVSVTRLSPGSKLVVYSDGLTDAENPAGESFGSGRVRELLRSGAALGSDALLAHISSAVRAFEAGALQKDDLTVMVAEYNREDAHSFSLR